MGHVVEIHKLDHDQPGRIASEGWSVEVSPKDEESRTSVAFWVSEGN